MMKMYETMKYAVVALMPLLVAACEDARVGILQTPVYMRPVLVGKTSLVQRAAEFNRKYDGMLLNQVAVTQQELLLEGGRLMLMMQRLGINAECDSNLKTFVSKMAELCENYHPAGAASAGR